MSSPDIQLREAHAGDAEALSALAQETYAVAFGHTMAQDDLATRLEHKLSPAKVQEMLEDDTFIVAVSDKNLIGFVQFGAVKLGECVFAEPTTLQPEDGQIKRLYVRAAYQNLGLGRQLLDASLHHPHLKSRSKVYIGV